MCDGGLAAFGGNNTSGPIEVASACRAKGGSGHGDFESETFITVGTLVTGHSPNGHGMAGVNDQAVASGHVIPALEAGAVRRLTPREFERLQGFPDDYTLIRYPRKRTKDGPRYKAIGNSMAVPVMRWIGTRIDEVATLQGVA
jgi:DNA (cytosine-5)-methyltransferase 1